MFKRIAPLPGREKPLVFAHRGLSSEAPENTMAAFRLARQYGIPGIELDVHLSEDGAIVVMHDETTERVCPGSNRRISDSRISELRKLDIGSWKDPRWAGERVPVLAELFEEFRDCFYFDIEIKGKGTGDLGLEAAIASLLDDFKLDAETVFVSSFNPVILRRFKVLSPRIPTAIIYHDHAEMPPYLRRGEGRWIGAADFLKPKHTELHPLGIKLGRMLHGRPVLPWTVDTPEDAARVLTMGCIGVISNKPHQLGLNTGDKR